MGCPNSKVSEQQKKSVKVTPFNYKGIGLLKVTIQPIKEVKKSKQFFSLKQNFIQLTLCDQTFHTGLRYDEIIQQTLNPTKNQFNFVINQVNIQKCLEVKILSQSGDDSLIKTASGKEVLKEAFFQSETEDELQTQSYNLCLTSEEDVCVGWIRVSFLFIPCKYDILIVRVNSVTLRNQSKQGHPVYVNIKIGGQFFETESKRSTEKSIPEWQNAMHPFIVPSFLTHGNLSVYAKNQREGFDYLVGELKFDLRKILESDDLQTFSQSITRNKDIKGTLCIQFLNSKDMMPQIQNLQRPKRIKFIETIDEEKLEKQARHVANYVSKKWSQATNSTANSSNNQVFQNKLNRKLKELKNDNFCIPLEKGYQNYQNEPVHQMIEQKNEFYYDRQIRCQRYLKGENPEYLMKNPEVQRIFSDPQLSFQLDIPQTSSRLIQKKSRLILQDNQRSVSRSSRKSSVQKRKQGIIKIQRESKLQNKSSKRKIDLFQCQKQNFVQIIQQKLKIKVQIKEQNNSKVDLHDFHFDSLPGDMVSKSVCFKKQQVLQNNSQNKSQIFSSSLNEKSTSNENHDKFSNEIKAMEDMKKILIEQQKQLKEFQKNQRTKNIQQICNEINQTQRQMQQTRLSYSIDDFQIKISSIIAKKGIVSNS